MVYQSVILSNFTMSNQDKISRMAAEGDNYIIVTKI